MLTELANIFVDGAAVDEIFDFSSGFDAGAETANVVLEETDGAIVVAVVNALNEKFGGTTVTLDVFCTIGLKLVTLLGSDFCCGEDINAANEEALDGTAKSCDELKTTEDVDGTAMLDVVETVLDVVDTVVMAVVTPKLNVGVIIVVLGGLNDSNDDLGATETSIFLISSDLREEFTKFGSDLVTLVVIASLVGAVVAVVNWKVTCFPGVKIVLDLPIMGTTADVEIGDVLILVVEVDEFKVVRIDDGVNGDSNESTGSA